MSLFRSTGGCRLSARLCIAWLLFGLTGCATYTQTIGSLEAGLSRGDTAAALSALDQSGAAREPLLYHLNRGMILRLAGDYRASNAAFEEAKRVVEANSALSVREQSAAFVINDGVRAYEGEPFEQVSIHLFEALNYLDLGDLPSARVEALQVDQRLKGLSEQESGTPFGSDPFARYLAGMIFESLGEWSDAMIAYRKALEAYDAHGKRYPLAIPAQLPIDLLRLSAKLGLQEENRQYQERFGISRWMSEEELAAQGEVVLIFSGGLAPVKRERVAMQGATDKAVVAVALPYYERRYNDVVGALLLADGNKVATDRVEDIDAIAVETLKARMGAITARALARAVAKHELSRRAGKENPLAGFLTNVAGLVTERADTRSWITLPSEIRIARIALPPGSHNLTLELTGPAGEPRERHDFGVITLQAGERRFLSYHRIPAIEKGRE